jgi:hypothetical protein
MVAANQAFLMYSNVKKKWKLELDRFLVMTITYPSEFPGPTNLSNISAIGIFFLAICVRKPVRFQRNFLLYFFPKRVSEN